MAGEEEVVREGGEEGFRNTHTRFTDTTTTNILLTAKKGFVPKKPTNFECVNLGVSLCSVVHKPSFLCHTIVTL